MLFSLLAASASAQENTVIVHKPGQAPVTYYVSPVVTATATATLDPAQPTATNTPTSSATNTPIPGTVTNTPTKTFTPTFTITPTPTGTINTPTPSATATPPITRASLVLLPTAYSNAWNRWDGFNWDMDFTYFIGSILSRDNTKPNLGLQSLDQINLVLLTTDVKYAWLDEDEDVPAIASGIMMSALAQVGSSTGTSTTNQTIHVAGNTVGAAYTTLSMALFQDMAVHFGYLYGFRELSGKSGVFSMNYTQILPYLGPGLKPISGESPASMAYIGFNTRFLGRNWKFELMKPFPMSENPVLLNTQVDGLPLAFNLGYERWDHGYAILGYVNFRIPLLPQTPEY